MGSSVTLPQLRARPGERAVKICYPASVWVEPGRLRSSLVVPQCAKGSLPVVNEPLVSILTPSFNQARWLVDNVQSVARQTYPRIEHIVMDGGSTDGTVDLLAQAGERITWQSEPDRGQSHALNKALAASTGEIIGWINSDDAYYDVDAVAAVAQCFARHPDVDVVYGHAALVNADGRILQMLWAPPFRYGLLRLTNFIVQPAAFIRRSALGATLVDETFHYAMDYELWLRLGQERRIAKINHVVAVDRNYPERKSVARTDLAEIDYARLRRAYGAHDFSPPAAVRARQRALKIALRLMGVSLVPKTAAHLAFDGSCDSMARLAARQVAVPRAAMMAREQRSAQSS
jgi:glycosyltransferase involved in cell wall biosynthesis